MADRKPRPTNRARELRNAATPAERRLWEYLSGSQLNGYKFSRQIPVGADRFIGDLVCRSAKLVIELDGYSHDLQQGYDARRTRLVEREGWQVIRFTNDDVLERLEGVVTKIAEALAERPTPGPSRKREGGS